MERHSDRRNSEGTTADVSGNFVRGNYIGLDKDGWCPCRTITAFASRTRPRATRWATRPRRRGRHLRQPLSGHLDRSTGRRFNVIQGNFIGTDKTGVLTDTSSQGGYKLGNAYEGIEIHSSHNIIGGAYQRWQRDFRQWRFRRAHSWYPGRSRSSGGQPHRDRCDGKRGTRQHDERRGATGFCQQHLRSECDFWKPRQRRVSDWSNCGWQPPARQSHRY